MVIHGISLCTSAGGKDSCVDPGKQQMRGISSVLLRGDLNVGDDVGVTAFFFAGIHGRGRVAVCVAVRHRRVGVDRGGYQR